MSQPAPTRPPEADWYEIRIQGRLDQRWSTHLDGVHLVPDGDGTTVLTGRAIDQAALHGLLTGLQDLGLPLVSVTRVDPAPAPLPHHHPSGEPT